MSFPKYDTYKDSGHQWGEAFIPTYWHVRRLKSMLSEPLRYGANESAEGEDRNEPRFVRITDINEDGGLRDETFKSLPAELAEPFLLREGDMLFARSGATVGKSFMYSKEWGTACFAGYLIRARLNLADCLPIWLSYFCQTNSYWAYISGSQIQSTIQNVSAEKYANLYLPLPDLTEQKAITSFLNRETSKIDALVAEQRRLIELLNEKRQAVISHAVTKGLDANVKMKPSGIEWLGDVPAHWEVTAIKRMCQVITDGAHISPETENGEYCFVSTKDVSDDGIDFGKCLKTSASSYEYLVRAGCKPFVNDVLFSKDGTIGRTVVIEEDRDFVVASSLIIIRPIHDMLDPQYLHLLCQSTFVKHQVEQFVRGAGLPRISITNLCKVVGCFPPKNEQREIGRFLHYKVQEFRRLQAEAVRAIALLQERRTALISAAVTGKIDVRGFEPISSNKC